MNVDKRFLAGANVLWQRSTTLVPRDHDFFTIVGEKVRSQMNRSAWRISGMSQAWNLSGCRPCQGAAVLDSDLNAELGPRSDG